MGSTDKVRIADSRCHSSTVGMEEDMNICATPEAVRYALSSEDPPVVESGKGDQSKREIEKWLVGRYVSVFLIPLAPKYIITNN